jgi:uncharacterized repeat protein (TIGR03803 family)
MSKLSLWRTVCLAFVFSGVGAITSPAQIFTSLLSFNGADGAFPANGLLQGFGGNLNGTASSGGAYDPSAVCCGGTVFKITSGGTLTTLHSFADADGCSPYAGLVQASNGNFYGDTYGAYGCGAYGDGTVFEITPGGRLTTLHSFEGPPNGSSPYAGLVHATDGSFYGTTYLGGAGSACGSVGCGTVFKIGPGGTLTTLHSFEGPPDGSRPYTGLVQATGGNFYGTTYLGGAGSACGSVGCGTVFRITPRGTLTTLHSFDGTDGAYPTAGLVQATNGNFYGTTGSGGAYGGGTVFEISAGGTLTTLHSFDCFHGTEGCGPSGPLAQATDGNFYGMTRQGGDSRACDFVGCGTIFEITSGGTLTTLHTFEGADGAFPPAGLVQATNGNFYGTTEYGGSSSNCLGGCGTVFSLSVGLGPFVETLPTSGKVGTPVIILGNNLTGSTSVTFNGSAATFKVVSGTEISTTVPSGATTGKVEVNTPHGALVSNVNFRVT